MEVAPLFTTTKFNEFLSKNRNPCLQIIHINMQSAVNKADQLQSFLDGLTCSFDLVLLSETWYRSDIDVIRLPGYESFFLNHPTKRGGGVALLVRNAYSCHILSEHCFSDANMKMLTVSSGNLAFCVIVHLMAT